ncbi:glycosyltransferase [Curtobacterium sp. MCSS17_007]|uniref:glycosyltransferase n=1 Tax=Curtobacterium sp. MCSS17_007 TaxID=2175646 RepID=UPI0011B51868|nr:glycosyltransferase [Curtobacterium sp. MCSS17_007]WIE76074.1 glycosyltransferase [Curtobacterium sp. MCSS17_007]
MIVAAPLSARSGVYRSTLDLVAAARRRGLDWQACIGVRAEASGRPTTAPGVIEYTARDHGARVVHEVQRRSAPSVAAADVVISMVPQSDVAVSAARSVGSPLRIAWVRGLPWPARGEQPGWRRSAIAAIERRALRRADAVWVTSPLLREEMGWGPSATVVPAGIPILDRRHDGSDAGELIFAGRLSAEKNIEMFLEVAHRTALPARVHGEGPLLSSAQRTAASSVRWHGWTPHEDVWAAPGTLLCPSHREAFGRSAVEAASAGVPVVLSDRTGVAPLLFRDPDLERRFVLPVGDVPAWVAAVRALTADEDLRRRVSSHLAASARRLSEDASLDAALAALDTLMRTP